MNTHSITVIANLEPGGQSNWQRCWQLRDTEVRSIVALLTELADVLQVAGSSEVASPHQLDLFMPVPPPTR